MTGDTTAPSDENGENVEFVGGEESVHGGKGPLRAGNSERETTGLSAPIDFWGKFSWFACDRESVCSPCRMRRRAQ
jgi:hypothetical protein